MKEIDWANLSFGYMRTDYNVRINFRNGKWGVHILNKKLPFCMLIAIGLCSIDSQHK